MSKTEMKVEITVEKETKGKKVRLILNFKKAAKEIEFLTGLPVDILYDYPEKKNK